AVADDDRWGVVPTRTARQVWPDGTGQRDCGLARRDLDRLSARGRRVALVLVHGSPAEHTTFEQLVPHLEPWVTVYAMDRRGRGMSGGPSYSHEREFEDVAAVVDALGPAVDVFGHSDGCVVALEAAPLTTNLRRLIL
ncbi:MAG: alpha/beta hydrolase, partial [Actinomycetota bacterium]|nr:alpha/beta hydrolase [Actinomycetota bacterium]